EGDPQQFIFKNDSPQSVQTKTVGNTNAEMSQWFLAPEVEFYRANIPERIGHVLLEFGNQLFFRHSNRLAGNPVPVRNLLQSLRTLGDQPLSQDHALPFGKSLLELRKFILDKFLELT